MDSPTSRVIDDWTVDSPEQTAELGATLASKWSADDCLGLIGPLGAGKTTFVKGVVDALGGDSSDVRSPTYALLQHYPETTPEVTHADLYRTEGPDQQETLGLEEYMSETLALVEWAERWSLGWPASARTILFEHGDRTTRSIYYVDDSPDTLEESFIDSVFPSEGVLD